MQFKALNNIAGWITFIVAAIVLGAAAQPTGSLWDCGEFVSGAYKLQVVHPPGAPVFLIVGRLFAWLGSLVSDDPSTIAYSVNLLSALSTAFTGMFACWSTTIVGRLAIVGRDAEPEGGSAIAIAIAGIIAGLATSFSSSMWFSAVEGEVYAMSLFFTGMTFWAALKWYNLPDTSDSDRWLVFAIFSTGLSIGVHLLSLLTFPAIAMLYYYKKARKANIFMAVVAFIAGAIVIGIIQQVIITGIPGLWATFDKMMVNSGLPVHSGIIPVALIFFGLIGGGLFLARAMKSGILQRIVVAFGLIVVAYMTYGTVVIRANANPPINMNNPSDAMRLLPYLNREQYGERPLFRGTNFDARPIDVITEPRYGLVETPDGPRYQVVDEKIDYKFNPKDKIFFPRMGDFTQNRPDLYYTWIGKKKGTKLTFGDNIKFFFRYQLNWMYIRYFMWNFVGRQNGEQGMMDTDPARGNWLSGITPLDEARLGNQSQLPDDQKHNQARNVYYGIPLLLGLFGFFFHALRRQREFTALLAMFFMTGIAIILYSNQPPSEPRERDYVLVGSFFTFTIWIGLGALAIFELLRKNIPSAAAVGVSAVIGLAAPLLMVTQNWDDHSRAKQFASRDYAQNFLESCAPNAIIFTYGDNDTYPLWYCQEVEGIRTDVRVVNLSLIAVDWYIEQMGRKVNNSPAIKMTIPADKMRGYKRVQIPYYAPSGDKEMTIQQVIGFLAQDHQLPSRSGRGFDTYLPTSKIAIPVDKDAALKNGIISATDSAVVDTIHFQLALDEENPAIIKDQLAIMDIVASNIWERPIYWAVTCREDRLIGLEDYLQMEGLALRLVPFRTDSRGTMDQFGGIIGAGRVDPLTTYKNIMEKWKWGNFDKERQFVDNSFMPSLQTQRMVFIRTARQLAAMGEKEKAIALTDKYFEVFPNFNMTYDQFAALMADVYARAGANEKASAKIREIAKVAEQQFNFYESQPANFKKAYQQDFNFARSTVANLLNTAGQIKDTALEEELENLFGKYLQPEPGMQR